MNFLKTGARWIWDASNSNKVNQYLTFRQEFQNTDCHSLIISCDTNYAAWINGEFVESCQYLSLPKFKFYDKINIEKYLKKGKNLICILAYYQGIGTSCYSKGIPGLIYAIESDKGYITNINAKVSHASGFKEGEMPMISRQLGPSFEYDARLEQNWISEDYDDSKWENVRTLEFSEFLPSAAKMRPIKKTDNSKRSDCLIIGKGFFKYANAKGNTAVRMSKAKMVSHMPVPENGNVIEEDNTYIILDLGKETSGYFELDIEADGGVQVDIAWGEHLTDMRIRSHIDYRHFAFSYYTGVGRKSFINYFRRIAGRFIQINFSGVKSPVILHYAGIRTSRYPVKVSGTLKLTDSLHQKIYDTCIYTLTECMHDHYEDSPWREQSLYAFDGRNQALFGYPVFKNYKFALSSIELLGSTLGDDGFIDICAPSDTKLKIPSFSMMWIVFASEYVEYSKDIKNGKKLESIADKMVSAYKQKLKNGLLPQPEGELYWNFYDWAEGLSIPASVKRRGVDAVLNLYFCYALKKLIALKKAVKSCYKEELNIYQTVKAAINNTFYDCQKNLYRTYTDKEHYSQLVQAMAIISGVSEKPSLLRKMLASCDSLVKVTLSTSVFKYEALLGEKKYANSVLNEIKEIWGGMLFRGATTFYETENGENDFNNAGSLCHGWSAVPLYVYHKIGGMT